jgi:tRNA G18 (ribose-2'-O)-methylase SpoU
VSTPIPVASLDDVRVADYGRIGDPAFLHSRGLFVAEGRLVVRRLLASPRWVTRSALVTKAAASALSALLESCSAPIYLVDQALMNALAGFDIHRGCLALAERPPDRALAAADLEGVSHVVALEGVSNPDNVGGIFRSAAAFGAGLVLLGPGCGDPLYRKAMRTSMAAALAVPFVSSGPWPDALALLRARRFLVMALTPDPRAVPLRDATITSARVALLLGAEGEGLSERALAHADVRVRIPIDGVVDSLNVASAASIAMYHVFGRS